jgi:hypothetical protein
MLGISKLGLLGVTLFALMGSPWLWAQESNADEQLLKEARSAVREARQLMSETGGGEKVGRLLEAATRLAKQLSREANDDQIGAALSSLESCLIDLERDPSIASGSGMVKQLVLNLRWKIRRMGEILEGDEEERSFTVGPVTPQQGGSLDGRLDELLARAGTMKGLLSQCDPEMMYRNLLILQMQSLVEPVAVVRQELRGDPPWWTPEAYRAVLQIQRIINLTRNETRNLTPQLAESLRQVWTTSESLIRVVNAIEQGARDSGPDAKIVYRPRPGQR